MVVDDPPASKNSQSHVVTGSTETVLLVNLIESEVVFTTQTFAGKKDTPGAGFILIGMVTALKHCVFECVYL